MTQRDKQEFRAYLRACTNAQVQGVYAKEHDAGREPYVELALDELYRRGLSIECAPCARRIA